MYDTIIIGSGPAGMTAGIFAARREMKAIIIGKDLGGQMVWANEIENYPGFKKISGFELIQNFQEQVLALGVEMKSAEVQKIEKTEKNTFLVYFGPEVVEGKTIIITMGLSPRRLAIKGEEEFTGKGVSYCANCDAPFFKNKKVAVVGSGNSAFDAAEVLSKIANEVSLIIRTEEVKAFNSLVETVKNKSNIKIYFNSEIKDIIGDKSVSLINCANIKEKTEFKLEVDGVFVEIGRIASTDLVENFVDRNNRGQIITNNRCETKTPGVFAAGDVSSLSEFKQISVAVGQATIAALVAYQYLQTENK